MELKTLKSLNLYLQSLIETKLWFKVLVAVFAGVIVGFLISPDLGLIGEKSAVIIGDWLALPGNLFIKLVQMIMIPLIFASIIRGIISNTTEQLKSMGVSVGLYFVATTIISISIGTVITSLIKPGNSFNSPSLTEPTVDQNNSIEPTNAFSVHQIPHAISDLLPENPLVSMITGEMLSIVIFTIIIGIAITSLKDSMQTPIVVLLSSIQEICMTIVRWAMKLVPMAAFGFMAQLTSRIGLDSIKGIGLYVMTVLLGLFILLLIYILIIVFLAKERPLKFLKQIRDVQLLAFSTTSSAAVMPLSLKTAEDKLSVSPAISNFLIPIGATINMDGTAIYQCISALFIAQAYQIEMSLMNTVLVMITLVASSIGTPAIPGGGV
ncbi:MAG: dicarboxylate/amino acid:cation symporter, partial [Bacteroidota bacterium]